MTLSESDIQRPECEARTIEALASTLDIAISVFDRNDTLIAASSGLSRMFNVPPELMLPGARLRDILGALYDVGVGAMGSHNGKPRTIAREDWVAERIAVHWRERYESVGKLADGRWIRMRKRRMPDGLLISVVEDLTEQKRKEAELLLIQQKAELAQIVLDDLPYPVIVKDAELRYVIVNKVFCRIKGLKPKQVLGLTVRDLVEPEIASRYEKAERKVLETGISHEAKEKIFWADGTGVSVAVRMHRSGVPGNHFVTVLFEDNDGFLEAATIEAGDDPARNTAIGPVRDRSDKSADSADRPVPRRRVLVVDEDPQRSAVRVAALKQSGADALAVASADEAVAFLDAADTMNLVVADVEISAQLAAACEGKIMSAQHGVLKRAIEICSTEQAVSPASVEPTVLKAGPETSIASSVEPAQLREVPNLKSPTSSASPVSPPRKRVRVLVAEDNDVNQIVFEQILEGLGVDFRIVANGQEAVAAWQAAAPDIILMDISMPVMNGLQAAQAIRDAETAAGDATVHVPIIAVTAHAMSGDRERCIAAGMDDYLSKPVSPEKLETMIGKWIDLHEGLRAAG